MQPRILGVVRRHWLVTTVALIIGLPVVVFVSWTEIALHYTYSSGVRAGYLQKLSKKGWLCKTWEGEMQVTAIPGSVPEKFAFSVRSDSIAAELNKYNGRQVVIDYAQHVGVPTSCFGDTEYYATGVRLVGGP